MTELAQAARRLAFELSTAGLLDIDQASLEDVADKDALLSREAVELLRDLNVFAIALDENDREIRLSITKRTTAAQRSHLPESYDGFPIDYDYEKIVSINPGRLKPRELRSEPLANNVVRCGDSIGPGNDRSAGTLGALVRDRRTGALFGLTCNHVIGGCNNMPAGVPIVSPGVIDVVQNTRKVQMIGRHARVIPLRQGQASVFDTSDNIDAALFSIEDESLVCSSQRGYFDTPTEIADPEPGMDLAKVGRTTDYRKGRIRSRLEFPIPIDYSFKIPIDHKTTKSFQGVCTFGNAWIVDHYGDDFAAAGDSGSLVVEVPVSGEEVEPRAVGLLFAATAKGKGYILPIRTVLDAFNVELVASHNLP